MTPGKLKRGNALGHTFLVDLDSVHVDLDKYKRAPTGASEDVGWPGRI